MNYTKQVSTANATRIAADILAAVRNGHTVTVNGTPVIDDPIRPAAVSYMNGSVAYRIAAKTPGKTRDAYVRRGHMITVDIQRTGALALAGA